MFGSKFVWNAWASESRWFTLMILRRSLIGNGCFLCECPSSTLQVTQSSQAVHPEQRPRIWFFHFSHNHQSSYSSFEFDVTEPISSHASLLYPSRSSRTALKPNIILITKWTLKRRSCGQWPDIIYDITRWILSKTNFSITHTHTHTYSMRLHDE